MLSIGGIQKTSLIDFPGRVSCVLFFAGCNFHCPYCHNPGLVGKQTPSLFEAPGSLAAYLTERRSLLDGVVLSGGEPTLQNGLVRFCAQLKQMGYAVKLDTNGSRPEVLQQLLAAELIDYAAMDLKTDPADYFPLVSSKNDPQAIHRSIELLRREAPDYEFRTTCAQPFVTRSRFEAICRCIAGARRYVLQRFQCEHMLTPAFFDDYPDQCSDADLLSLKAAAESWVECCQIR